MLMSNILNLYLSPQPNQPLDMLDIMEHNAKVKNLERGSRREREPIQLLQIRALHFDYIVRKMDTDSKTIRSLLSLMELKGKVQISFPSFNYIYEISCC